MPEVALPDPDPLTPDELSDEQVADREAKAAATDPYDLHPGIPRPAVMPPAPNKDAQGNIVR